MKIRILRPCYMTGKVCKKGEVVDAPARDANEAIGLKKAEAVAADKPDDGAKPDGEGQGGKKGGAK